MQNNLQRAKKSDRIFRSLTGIDTKAFHQLEKPFGQVFNKFIAQQAALQPRERAVGGGRTHTLKTTEDKLFFILFYLKVYPTFDLAGFFYDVDCSQFCHWVRLLMPVFQETLGRELVLPK